MIRQEIAQAGFHECINFILCSLDESTAFLKKKENQVNPVIIENPKTKDFQCSRTSLISGLLKTLNANKSQRLPIKLFEAGDVVIRCDNETGARNERRLAVLITDQDSSNLETIHGILNHLMKKLDIPIGKGEGYEIQESCDETFFEGRQAKVYLGGQEIGIFGILHPDVLENFEISTPVSLLELSLEKMIDLFLQRSK